MLVKTSELAGPALDRAVFTASGFTYNGKFWEDGKGHYYQDADSPSTNWAQGGPIIEREGIAIDRDPQGGWLALYPRNVPWILSLGPTPLIAAMRGYVANKLGNEVEIPDELI